MVVLIDADSIVWITAYNCIGLDTLTCKDVIEKKTDQFVQNIIDNTVAISYIGFLEEGSINFRHRIISSYKAQRPERPDFYSKYNFIIRTRLKDYWDFKMVRDIESDDAVAICAEYFRGKGIQYTVCGADKDLKQLEGHYYDYRKNKWDYINKREAEINLFTQVLTGDTADNIKGCPGVGPKKAEEIIKNRNQRLKLPGGQEVIVAHPIHQAVLNAFVEELGMAKGINSFTTTFNLVYLLREHETFKVPNPIEV